MVMSAPGSLLGVSYLDVVVCRDLKHPILETGELPLHRKARIGGGEVAKCRGHVAQLAVDIPARLRLRTPQHLHHHA